MTSCLIVSLFVRFTAILISNGYFFIFLSSRRSHNSVIMCYFPSAFNCYHNVDFNNLAGGEEADFTTLKAENDADMAVGFGFSDEQT